MQALDDLRVLDLSQGIAGSFATKQLADFGADVIKVEPPHGDVCRTFPPFRKGLENSNASGIFAFLNSNKRSVVFDPTSERYRANLRQLVKTADILIEHRGSGGLDQFGMTWGDVSALNPRATLVSISDFGDEGPYRDYNLTELTLFAFAGSMHDMGIPEREPVKMAGTAALIQCGATIISAIMGALFAARRDGVGQHVRVALADIHMGSCDRRTPHMLTYQFVGQKALRPPLGGQGAPAGIYPCLDGFVDFTAAALRRDRLRVMLGAPSWLDEPEFNDAERLRDPEVVERWNSHFLVWCLERTMREIWNEASRAGVLCAPLFSTADIFEDETFRGRGMWAHVNHPELGEFDMPGRPFVMQQGGWELRRPAPLLGQHTEEVVAECRERAPEPVDDTSAPPVSPPAAAPGSNSKARPGKRPLDGIRVLDLTLVIAGTYGTMLLADLGAEVIKLENALVMQPMTRSNQRRPPETPEVLKSYPGGRLGPRPWNAWALQVAMYRNKKSVTIDLRRPEGLENFRRLVEMSDVVCENNAIHTLEKFGITYDWLRSINPNIIYMRLPAFGLSGSYSESRALGWHIEAVAGHTRLRGYDDIDASANNTIYAADFLSGLSLSYATLFALWHRQRTGHGQLVEVSQVEAATAFGCHGLMDFSLNGNVVGPIGNRDVHGRYPCNVYPARSPGSSADGGDRWIAIHVQSDDEWRALQDAMGYPEWAAEPQFQTNSGRARSADVIDRGIAEWTCDKDDYELMHTLQRRGISAAPVLEASRALADPHLLARGFFQQQKLDHGDSYTFPGLPFSFERTPIDVYQDPVTLGEHNEYVYRDLLGISTDEYEALEQSGHIATEFDESIP